MKVTILDNLREGVLTPDIYDPAINPLYRDLLAHYGVVAVPCRVGDPDRKGKVESAIGHTQAALKGLRFESLEEAQTYLDRWDARWADTRIHGTTKRQVAAMFAEERLALPELVGVGQEHFHEAALPVRSPHHGASGEAARPQRVHRVSCAAARRVRSRCSLTIVHRLPHRQRITVRSDRSSERQPAQTRAAFGPIRTGK